MTTRPIVILHGWSDTSKSFLPLVKFLHAQGFHTVPLWLGDYVSLDDDVSIPDVAKRMEEVVRTLIDDGTFAREFDLIVHSTGGLVARQWISTYYPDGTKCPARRLVMLAPANFGSRLASLGQSMLGRVVRGFNNWFHTGKEMLRALELSSPFQWDLSERDLFVRGGDTRSPYGPKGVRPFVIVGTRGYDGGLREIVSEDGSDGTVRVCAANLNARGVTVDFSKNESTPAVRAWEKRHGDRVFPFAVLPDRDHATIVNPGWSPGSAAAWSNRLGELLVEALRCPDDDEYARIAERWAKVTTETEDLATQDTVRAAAFPTKGTPKAEPFHRYLQACVRVIDDHGNDIDDYFLEFFSPKTKGSREAVYFHSQVLEHAHTHSVRPSHRCLYIDETDLLTNFYPKFVPKGSKRELAVSLSARPPGENITYFRSLKVGAAGQLRIHTLEPGATQWLNPHETLLVHVIIPRAPREGVFRLQAAAAQPAPQPPPVKPSGS